MMFLISSARFASCIIRYEIACESNIECGDQDTYPDIRGILNQHKNGVEVSRMESTTRDLSASSESRDMPWLLDGSEYFDMEPAKPKPSSSSDMPESSVNVPHVKQKPPDSNHRSNSINCDSIGTEMKDSEHSEKDYCTLGWCAIGQLHTGCSCGRVNPCVYCTDSE